MRKVLLGSPTALVTAAAVVLLIAPQVAGQVTTGTAAANDKQNALNSTPRL